MDGDLVLDMLKWVRVSVGHSCIFWAAFHRTRKIIRLICFPPSNLGKIRCPGNGLLWHEFLVCFVVFCIHAKYRGKLLINVNEWDLHWNALKIGWYKWLQVRYKDAWKFKKFITAINDPWMKTDSVGQIPIITSITNSNFQNHLKISHYLYIKFTENTFFFSSPGNIPKR